MKSISIMRLKLLSRKLVKTQSRSLKWKASQLWDWNIIPLLPAPIFMRPLKWKASQLWDWNVSGRSARWFAGDHIEMKSISIMRLKHYLISRNWQCRIKLKWKASQLWDWNIPLLSPTVLMGPSHIEMKSISIMRLKQDSPKVIDLA